jgi:hypothetical protein
MADRSRQNESALPDTFVLLQKITTDLGGGVTGTSYSPTGAAVPCRVTRPTLPSEQLTALQVKQEQLFRVSMARNQAALLANARLRVTSVRGTVTRTFDLDFLQEAIKSQPTEYAIYCRGPV